MFSDFLDINGKSEFFSDEEPNWVKIVDFKVETLEDLSLLHSGSKALIPRPGEEGKIVYEKAIE